jgi:quercetin dioxygenase-like cupin family protein
VCAPAQRVGRAGGGIAERSRGRETEEGLIVVAVPPRQLEFSDAWIDGEPRARWRSASALGPGVGAVASGCSVLEVEAGCRLGRHTDSAEETVIVLDGQAEVVVNGRTEMLSSGALALIPKDVPHEVRNHGAALLRFVAVYARPDVVTTYERPVQPSGDRERSPVA